MAVGYDRGHVIDDTPIDLTDHPMADWEGLAYGVLRWMFQEKLARVDELRRAIEGLDPAVYESLTYYQRWVPAIETLLIEKGVLTREQIDAKEVAISSKWG